MLPQLRDYFVHLTRPIQDAFYTATVTKDDSNADAAAVAFSTVAIATPVGAAEVAAACDDPVSPTYVPDAFSPSATFPKGATTEINARDETVSDTAPEEDLKDGNQSPAATTSIATACKDSDTTTPLSDTSATSPEIMIPEVEKHSQDETMDEAAPEKSKQGVHTETKGDTDMVTPSAAPNVAPNNAQTNGIISRANAKTKKVVRFVPYIKRATFDKEEMLSMAWASTRTENLRPSIDPKCREDFETDAEWETHQVYLRRKVAARRRLIARKRAAVEKLAVIKTLPPAEKRAATQRLALIKKLPPGDSLIALENFTATLPPIPPVPVPSAAAPTTPPTTPPSTAFDTKRKHDEQDSHENHDANGDANGDAHSDAHSDKKICRPLVAPSENVPPPAPAASQPASSRKRKSEQDDAKDAKDGKDGKDEKETKSDSNKKLCR